MDEIISRLVAKDRLLIRAITKSEFIRESLMQKGYKLLKNEIDVNIILDYSNVKKNEMIAHFKSLYESGARFSLTIDEWTSLRNRRYFNICIHYIDSKFYNLGLAYILGKCGAIETRKIVETCLQEFELSFEHIISLPSLAMDRMSKKFGRESSCEMVFCLNDTIHFISFSYFLQKSLEFFAKK